MLSLSILFPSHCVTNKRTSLTDSKLRIYDPSNGGNDKDSWIMEDFDTTALEDIINCLDIDLPSSESRFLGYVESIANVSKEEIWV